MTVGVDRKSLKMIHDEVEYWPHQLNGIRTMARMSNFLLADEMGLGKAEPISEPVLTPKGWSTMGQLRVGDFVIGSDGRPTQVQAVYPQGFREVAKVTFQDGAFVRCDWDHLWSVNSPARLNRGNPNRIWSTRQILDYGLTVANGNRKHYIPMVSPVEYTPQSLLLDPYLLGILIGDGGLTGHTPVFESGEDTTWIASKVYNRLPNGDILSFLQGNRVSIIGTRTRQILETFGLHGKKSPDKHIPKEYLYSSIQDRLDLLHGLMDTDGTHVKGGGTEFSSTSEAVALAVVELARSLGGIAKISSRVSHFTYNDDYKEGLPSWRINVKLPPQFEPFSLPRKLGNWQRPSKYPPTRSIVSIEEDGYEECVCISVASSDHLYVTRDFIVTHNTLQALTVAAIDFELDRAKRILVISPVSLKWNWADEIKLHTNFTYILLNGTPAERDHQMNEYIASGTNILIVNYEQVRSHLTDFNKMSFDIVIYDEAHYMKNWKSKRTEACLKLVAGRHFLLTGSPLLNHVNELWPILHRIDPYSYPRYFQFVNRYAMMGGWKRKQIVGTKNKAELSEKVASVMIRRLKKDVLSLPDKQYIVVNVDLHPLQRQLYKQASEELEIDLPENPTPMELENALVKQLRLKQICGTTATIEGYDDVSIKLDRAVEMVQEITSNGEPVVVFTQFRKVQECMVQRLLTDDNPVRPFVLNGDTPNDQRIEVVKTWGDHTDQFGHKAALVAMLQVAGVGLNMTQASKAIFLDKLYVPKLNEQAEDRLHRIGTDATKPVQIYILSARNTIEQRIDSILRTKKKLFDTLIEESDWKKALYEALREQDEDEAA